MAPGYAGRPRRSRSARPERRRSQSDLSAADGLSGARRRARPCRTSSAHSAASGGPQPLQRDREHLVGELARALGTGRPVPLDERVDHAEHAGGWRPTRRRRRGPSLALRGAHQRGDLVVERPTALERLLARRRCCRARAAAASRTAACRRARPPRRAARRPRRSPAPPSRAPGSRSTPSSPPSASSSATLEQLLLRGEVVVQRRLRQAQPRRERRHRGRDRSRAR